VAVSIRGAVVRDGINTSRPSVTLPADTVSTDLIVVYEASEAATSDEMATAPTNGPWTQRAYSGTNASALPQAKIWTRTGLSGAATITSNVSEPDTHYLAVYVLTGADTTAIVANATTSSTGATTQTTTSLTASKAGLFIGFFTCNGSTAYTGVAGGLTEDLRRSVSLDNAFISGSKQVGAGATTGSTSYPNSSDPYVLDLRDKAGSDTATFTATDAASVVVPIAKTASDTATFSATAETAAIQTYTGKPASDTATFQAIDTAIRHTIGPTFGTWVSPPLALTEGPIAGSKISWDAHLPSGTALTVETSVDNGASWQAAEDDSEIQRLLVGSEVAKTVLVRVTITKSLPEDDTPRLKRLELRVATDTSIQEYLPLGVFTLNEVAIDDSPDGLQVELAGADLARRVSRNAWDNTFVIEENTNYATAIQSIIADRMPGATFNFASTERSTPRLFFGEQGSNDPWQDAQNMATAIGYELFFDPRGIRCDPSPTLMSMKASGRSTTPITRSS
jgi:hypothetical protein